MTIREFLENVVKAEISDEMTDFAQARIAKLDEKNEKKKKERALQRATLLLQDKYGKNAVLKGMNLIEGGTTIERNGQIGGHRAGGGE